MSIDDVKLYDLASIEEPNGSLAFIEMPFDVKRNFCVYGVRQGDTRGKHAHKTCEQFLICIRGSVIITCFDGNDIKEFFLASPLKGLYIPPMIWAEQTYHSNNTVLIGMASHHFDESDYIRDYDEYVEITS